MPPAREDVADDGHEPKPARLRAVEKPLESAAQTREIAQIKQWRNAWYADDAGSTPSRGSRVDGMPGM